MRVSIITVCFNAERTIASTIASVLAQKYSDYEHIIVDGASRDRTADVVRELRHGALKFVSDPDRGLYDAMNKGIAMAQGDLVGFLNADDFFCRTDALDLLVAAAEKHPAADAISAGVMIVDPGDITKVRRAYSSVGYKRWMLRFGHMPPHPGFYVRSAALKSVGGFDLQYRTSSDFDWMTRFYYAHKKRATALPTAIVAMRAGGITTRGWTSMCAVNGDIKGILRSNGVAASAAMIWSKYLFKVGQCLPARRFVQIPGSVRWPAD